MKKLVPGAILGMVFVFSISGINPETQDNWICDWVGHWAWQWGYCPSHIPDPVELTPPSGADPWSGGPCL